MYYEAVRSTLNPPNGIAAACQPLQCRVPRVYGSVLTGNDTEESDLDLLVDATESTTLFTLIRLEDDAQKLLGVPVSVLTSEFLSAKFRDRVLERAEPL